MGRPSTNKCAVVIERNGFSIRAARVGKGPLVTVWIHENGNGGRGIILDVEEAEELIEGLNTILDEIEDDPHAFANGVRRLLNAEGIDRL